MYRLFIIFLLLIIGLNTISCNENYPETVAHVDGFWSTNSRYEIEVNDFNQFPDTIQKFAKNYLIEKIGKQKFEKSKFTYGYIASNKPLSNGNRNDAIIDSLLGKDFKENERLDEKYNYPVYSVGFEYSDLSKGIEKYDLNFIIDKSGKVLKHIDFPRIEPENINFVPMDSIHKILSKRKIKSKNLELHLQFDRNEESLFYYARTLVRPGSILGPSCFPEYQEHFKVNAITGKIVEFDPKRITEYYDN